MSGGTGAPGGAVLEVRFADGVWYRGMILARAPGTNPPTWRVQFDDGEVRDHIRLGNPGVPPVRFDEGAYGATVEVRFDGEWYRGRLVELMRGSAEWGVAFEDGDWTEDVRLGDPDVRYVVSGGVGAQQGRKRGREVNRGARGSNLGTPRALAGRSRVSARKEGTAGVANGAKAHECTLCGKAFSDSSHLARHMRTHSGERPYVCETCGKAFTTSGTLVTHMRTHSGEKPYVCETCGKAFPTSSWLATHMRTHTGERPHVCETCGKAFTASGSLATHVRTHYGEKPYSCETCGKAFSQSSHLARHMRSHSGERPYVCETCGKAFPASGSLARHMRSHVKRES